MAFHVALSAKTLPDSGAKVAAAEKTRFKKGDQRSMTGDSFFSPNQLLFCFESGASLCLPFALRVGSVVVGPKVRERSFRKKNVRAGFRTR
jgi:hypothetical protein